MSTTYRRAKAEKFRELLLNKLSNIEFHLLTLKSEGKMDGFSTLYNQYKLLFDVTTDFCEEFFLEVPYLPEELSTTKMSQKELMENMRISQAINDLHYQKQFLVQDNMEVAHNEAVQALFSVIDIEEFFLHTQLDTQLPYYEAVKKMSKHAVIYTLTALGIKHPKGQQLLHRTSVMEGHVGRRHHFWLKIEDRYYLDLTLAQFTTKPIPYISLFRIEDAETIYTVLDEHTWQEWMEQVQSK